MVKFTSKFIYNFIYDYIDKDEGKKTYSVRLNKAVSDFGKEFLEGCLLGLVLSEGYLKDRFRFNVVSSKLAKNMEDILYLFGFNSSNYIHKRKKYGWKDLYRVSLNNPQSIELKKALDKTLRKLNYDYSFEELKYGPAQI